MKSHRSGASDAPVSSPVRPPARPQAGARLRPGSRALRQMAAFTRRQEGGVAVIAAFTLPVLLGFAGLALEYGQILLVRSEAQRTADLASHAAAAAYSRTRSSTAMIAAANGVARLNGFSADEIVVALDASFPDASAGAVRATITVPRRLFLPQLVGGDTSVDVVASAVAGALGGQPACIQALDPRGSGITLSGGTVLRADECAVGSNAAVTVPCGNSLITDTLTYGSGSHPMPGSCQTIRTAAGGATRISTGTTTDPLAGSRPLALAAEQLAATAALAPPAEVSVAPGPNIDFGWNQSATQAQARAAGCTASLGNSTWTFTCPGLATVSLGTLTLGGGLTLSFNPGAAADVTYNFSGRIHNTGTRMIFAGGRYNLAQGLVTGGGSVTEFGAGTYRIGPSTQACSGARYSICNTSHLSFAGPSTFHLPGGLRNDGGAVLTLGTGNGNSFRIGPSSGGSAISIGGGSQIDMGDAEGGLFEVSGRIDGGGGGSCLVIPAAALHQIKGAIIASGAVRFGAGLYAITGYLHLGSGGGGGAHCRGETMSVEALDTTFLIAGTGSVPGGGTCGGRAFCVSADYSNIRITAPGSGPWTDLAVIGPLEASQRAGAAFASGASGAGVAGAFYFPNGPIALSGGAGASGTGTGAGCFQVIGASIALSGGTSLASECRLSEGAGGRGRVVILR